MKNNKSVTAIEWLEKELNQLINYVPISINLTPMIPLDKIIDLVQQAKAMYKEQIKEVFIDVTDVLLKETNTQQKAKIKQAAEQYYNDTFKTK